MPSRRAYLLIAALALLWGSLLAILIRQPGYTDAYYYFNAGQRLAQGDGLTDPYLWVYINPPDHLPGPSHTYWMPLESLLAAGSMVLFGASFGAAQLPSVICFAGLVTLAFWSGARTGQSRRHAWIVGLLVLFGGFYAPFWITTDTFALYGLVGALALISLGRGRESGNWRWYTLSGACGALAHLARADGVLLLIVLILVAVWPRAGWNWRQAARWSAAGIAAYLLVMTPWLLRNWSEIDSPLPSGGLDTIWMRSYDELVNYPPGANPADFWNWGLGNIIQSRLTALANNLGTWVAVETWVILGPFVLIGLWLRRRDPFWLGVLLYAAGLHLAMTFVFAFPGYRGGLFHSSSALLPFWASAGLIGLDDAVGWMAKRRRWQRAQAQNVFSGALVVLAAVIGIGILTARLSAWNHNADFYRTLADDLPAGAVVMVNDPAALYYHAGLSGVVIPNADPQVVPEIAARYGVTHLVLDINRTEPFTGLFLGRDSMPFLRPAQVYGAETPDRADDRRVFEIVQQELGQ